MKNIILIFILVCCSLPLLAQKRVTGVVKDSAGEAIIGANIIQKGTINGTVSDIDGNFNLVLDNQNEQVVEVSMIGYRKSEINVDGELSLDIILQEDNIGLEEVVVVGFGTQKKASVTGSIANVSNDDLKDVPVSSATNALTGRVPGLITRQESGRPGGDDAKLFIRGRASLNNSDPLVLVDGIERSFSQVDPDDIESISILKDASATAVYGVRGANGVILVTTKRGEVGKSRITFSAEYGITEFNRISRVLNAEQTSRFQREGTINVGLDPSILSNTSNIMASEYDNYLYRTQLSPFTHPDNSFVDIFTKPGHQQKYNFNITGGNKAVKYFVSVGYFTQDGMFQTDVNEIRKHPTLQRLIELSPEVDNALVNLDYNPEYSYDRLTTRSNIDLTITEDLKVGIDLAYRFSQQNRPGTYDNGLSNTGPENLRLFAFFYRNAPQAFPLINPNGSMAGAIGVWRQNPLVTLSYTGFRVSTDNEMATTFNMNYNLRKLVKGLSIDGKFAYDVDWANWRGMIRRPYLYSYNPVDKSYTQGLVGVLPSQESERVAPGHNKYGELALRFNRTFYEKHNVSGVTLVTYNSESVPGGGEYSYVPHIYQALIARANYDYDNRYLLEVNMGYNGSNRFAEGHQYQLFPAASVGWIITNENFMTESRLLNHLKFRGSIGQVGNDRLGGFSYYYKSTYQDGAAYSFGDTHNARITGLLEGRMANELITWETSTKYNIGMDSRWFDSRFSINADVFKEHRTDILTNPARYIISSGINGVAPANIGIVDNKGYEIEAGWNSRVRNDFSYFVKGIFATAKNKVVEMSETAQPYDYMYATGHSIGQFIGYHYDGLFQSYEEIASSPTQFGLNNLAPGDIKYKDLNGDGMIDQNDQAPIGFSPVPEITYSLQCGFTFKGFDFSVMFQGAARSSVYMVGDLGWDNSWGNYYSTHINRWTPETGVAASYPRFLQKSSGSHQNYYLSDFWLLDGDYLRLKNIQLGYLLPKSILRNSPIQSVRLYSNAYNLLTWDKVKRVDPESNPDRNSGQFYPQQKILNFGLNVTF